MEIALIAALDENNGIGKNNQLLCYLPADLKRFKQLTTGHSIVMGRKTFESLPNGPLPKRKNIVLSTNKSYKAEGIELINSIEQLKDLCKNDKKVFIIGGAKIYNLFIKKADILYITRIHSKFKADTFFPEFLTKEWKLCSEIKHKPDEKNKYSYSFLDFYKIRNS